MARKTRKATRSPRREWVARYATRSEPQWRDLGYERMADWLHGFDDDREISWFRRLVSELARIRGYVAAARTYARPGEGDRYIRQPDRLTFVCSILQWANSPDSRGGQRIWKRLMNGDIPLPEAGSIKWKTPEGDRDPQKAGHAVARMVQQNILTRSLSDAVDKGLDVDHPWVLARVVKGDEDE